METLVVHPKNTEQQNLLKNIFREMRVSFEVEDSSEKLEEWQMNELQMRSIANQEEFVSAETADEISMECFK